MKKPNPRIELVIWLIVIYVSWYFISSCNVKVVPRSYFTNVKGGCLETKKTGFKREDILHQGCNCHTITTVAAAKKILSGDSVEIGRIYYIPDSIMQKLK